MVQFLGSTSTDEQGKVTLFGAGYEFERECVWQGEGEKVEWVERVQVVKSLALAHRQGEQLEERLRRAAKEIGALTPEEGRGRQQYREEGELREAVSEVLSRHKVSEYVRVVWEREEKREKRYEGRGRGGPGRAWHWEVSVRYQIMEVVRDEEAIALAKYRAGWRVQVTTLARAEYGLEACVLLYNGGWSLERDFHIAKDVPLGIRPLYVREEEQIIGLTRLLTIALRLLTLFETAVRVGLEKAGETLSGLYEGQPRRKTGRPTATRLLKAIARMEVTATRVGNDGGPSSWQITALPPLLRRILALANLAPAIYTDLADNSG